MESQRGNRVCLKETGLLLFPSDEMLAWTPEDVHDFLKNNRKMPHAADVLYKEGLNGQMLLTKKEFKELDEEPELKTAESGASFLDRFPHRNDVKTDKYFFQEGTSSCQGIQNFMPTKDRTKKHYNEETVAFYGCVSRHIHVCVSLEQTILFAHLQNVNKLLHMPNALWLKCIASYLNYAVQLKVITIINLNLKYTKRNRWYLCRLNFVVLECISE